MPTQDPWRKAYQLSRARTPEDAQPGTRTSGKLPPHLRRRHSPWPALLLLFVALLGAGGYYAWTQRGVLIPKYAKQLPAPAAKAVEDTPLPRQEIDVPLLDGGLGIGLAIGGDYLNLIGATRDWGVKWALVELGSGRTRASAPGVVVYASQGRITGYKLEVRPVFGAEEWQPWRAELNKAGLNEELNWRTATGEASMPSGVTEYLLSGRGGQRFAGEAASNSYMLYFRDGWLTRIEAGLSTGQPVPEPVIETPPDPEDAAQAPAAPEQGAAPPAHTAPPAGSVDG